VLKTEIWTEMNKDYIKIMEEKAEKAKRDEASGKANQPKVIITILFIFLTLPSVSVNQMQRRRQVLQTLLQRVLWRC
jgi:hypothetical protein